jgi:hypothetical protein
MEKTMGKESNSSFLEHIKYFRSNAGHSAGVQLRSIVRFVAVFRDDNVSSCIVVKVDVVLVRVAVEEIVIYSRCSRGYLYFSVALY